MAQADFAPVATGSPHVLGLFRQYGGQSLLALFNFREEACRITFEQKLSFTDLMTGEKHHTDAVTLAPYGFLWALEQ